jgi:hypothetical protein
MQDVFSEQEQNHYITMREIGQIRKDIERESIQLDPNNASSTWIWVETLQLEGNFVAYKDKLQLLKKLSQCLAVLKRLTYGKSNKLHNNLKIIYVILGHLGA